MNTSPAKTDGLLIYLDLISAPGGKKGKGLYRTVQHLNTTAPLGLFYLSAVAEKRGAFVHVLDQQVESFSEETLVKRIQESSIPFVGFYASDLPAHVAKVTAYIRYVKELTKVPVIVGGPPVDPLPFLHAGADAVAFGEGETPFQEWLEYMEGGRPLESIRGITYLQKGRAVGNDPAPQIHRLDDIPFPKRMNFHDYYAFGNPNCRKVLIEMLASRGCPMRCTYCSVPDQWGPKVRSRSVENVLQEITGLMAKHPVRYLHFRDDIFGATPRWLEQFIDAYSALEKRPHWSCYFHPLSFRGEVDRTMRSLSKAGLNLISYGLQSADGNILKAIDRSPDEPALLAEHMRAARKYGVLTYVSVIFGLPGDTRETIARTERWLMKNRPNLLIILPLEKLKGSRLDRQFKTLDEITSMTAQEMEDEIHRVTRRFYADPILLLRLIWYVLRRHPFWFLRSIPRLGHGFRFFRFNRKSPLKSSGES